MKIKKYNEVYLKVECDSDIAQELSEYFTFFVPGYKFMPAYRNKMWDGKIRLFNPMTRLIYAGVIKHIELFCQERNYDLEIDDAYAANEFSLLEANDFIASLNLPLEARDYQIDAFTYCVRNNRALMVSPTASGKSFIIYLLTRYYNAKTLIIVPTTTLVHQLASDFESYGYGEQSDNRFGNTGSGRIGLPTIDASGNEWTSGIHKIFSGQEKDSGSQITITTWQSIYKQNKAWFEKYQVVIGDEAHLFKAKSLTSIMGKMEDCKYRFGFTGTLDGTETHKLVLEGLFGPVRKVISTAELIEQKHVSDLRIKAIVLKYSEDIRKLMKDKTYQEEIDYLVTNASRNRFIKNLTLSLQGNTLLLYQYVDKHGKVLYDILKDCGRPIYFVHGGVDGEERDQIRAIVESDKNSIIVASYGTFSTGINIRNLHNIIFASPSKSRIRNLQSIGRGLRKSDSKDTATLYDIADDLTWKSRKNHTIGHFVERVKIYNEEKFEYKIYTVELK
jgi:superfamily II DNA or RNA helicase